MWKRIRVYEVVEFFSLKKKLMGLMKGSVGREKEERERRV